MLKFIHLLTASAAIHLTLLQPASAQDSTPQATPAPPAQSADDVQMFNGVDLTGWDGDPKLWSVKDGVIRGVTTEENKANGNTFLIWKGGEASDFVLRVTFRCSADNNSGVQYRSRHITDSSAKNAWVVRGYQHEVRNEEKLPNVSGFIYDEGGKRGRLCLVGEHATWTEQGKQVESTSLVSAEEFPKLFRLNDWNDAVIVAKGNRVQHFLNGQLILDFTDEHPTLALSSGVIALQLHAGKPMWAEFKNISLTKL